MKEHDFEADKGISKITALFVDYLFPFLTLSSFHCSAREGVSREFHRR